MTPSSRELVVVLGMHRSGTSSVTHGLEALGVALGDDLMPPSPDNPLGYFEDLAVLEINEGVLGALGLRWYDLPLIPDAQWHATPLRALQREAEALLEARLARFPRWGFKDPRTLRVLPFWNGVFEHMGLAPRYLVSHRNPLSIVRSHQQRDAMEPNWAHLLWLVYLLPHLELIAPHRHVVVDYDRLLTDPRGQLRRVAERLDLTPDAAAIDVYAEGFLSNSLRHTAATLEDLAASPDTDGLTLRCAQLLDARARDEGEADFWPVWRAQAQALAQIGPVLRYVASRGTSDVLERNRFVARVADLERQIAYLTGELAERDARLDALDASQKT